MECSNPGAIRDEELLAYVEGENVRPAVRQHIAACRHCSSEAKSFQRLERKLIRNLYRWDCPPNQVLGDFQFGLLDPQQSVAVRQHLSMCVLCKAEVAQLSDFLANDPLLVPQANPAPMPISTVVRPQGTRQSLESLLESSLAGARRIVAQLVPQEPRKAFQRNGSSQTVSWPRLYAAEDVNVSVQVEPSTSVKNALQVIGFVARKGVALESLDGTPVRLLRGTSISNSEDAETIDELGNFIFPAIEPGVYSMEISFKDGVVVIDQLHITMP